MSSPEEMLQDHFAELTHEHQVENCDHDEWLITDIEDLVHTEVAERSYVKCEITCSFCGKTNTVSTALKAIMALFNCSILTDVAASRLWNSPLGEWE